ncbi:hypothetical protein FOXB_04780 [Fusarium oxysporum f. sp. conglutinans Fo5176]|uniref:Alkaline ceramidase 3 n=1 Tax=Fusarium oxysporum (strain Fo5176) TaxID=660025 RepID=F9FEF2_FUSOF|nr:hypothetical protein FOXB_04780 [Fusarium oxysporum f. sp. conglutinans Fo5176]
MFEKLSLRIPYPPPQEGFWGQPTSTLNWCEEDYVISHYAAEITNTLTNLLFMALGVQGVRTCLKYKHDTVFVIAYLGYLLAYYHYIQDPSFHQNTLSILFLATVFRSLYTMEAILRPTLSNKYANKSRSTSLSDKEALYSPIRIDQAIIREMRWIVAMGFITCAAGIAAWTLDNLRCGDFVQWRHRVGLPWGILLEGHGLTSDSGGT